MRIKFYVLLINYNNAIYICSPIEYFEGQSGKSCEEQGGSVVKSLEECKKACDEIRVPYHKKLLRENKDCFRPKNAKKIRQTGKPGANAIFICKREGTL